MNWFVDREIVQASHAPRLAAMSSCSTSWSPPSYEALRLSGSRRYAVSSRGGRTSPKLPTCIIIESREGACNVTSYKLQITSYKLQVTSYKLQVTSYIIESREGAEVCGALRSVPAGETIAPYVELTCGANSAACGPCNLGTISVQSRYNLGTISVQSRYNLGTISAS